MEYRCVECDEKLEADAKFCPLCLASTDSIELTVQSGLPQQAQLVAPSYSYQPPRTSKLPWILVGLLAISLIAGLAYRTIETKQQAVETQMPVAETSPGSVIAPQHPSSAPPKYAAVPLTAQPASSPDSSPVAPKAGYWNIYASIPNGMDWFQDKAGVEANSRQVQALGDATRERLKACGIASEMHVSNRFSSFTPDLAVIHSASFADSESAKQQLAQAKQCGIDGYTKFAKIYPHEPG